VYEARGKGGLIYSDDHGATWHVGGVMLKNFADINTEVSLGETGDGEVYVNSRNGLKKGSVIPEGFAPHQRIYSRSRDGGESFYQEGCHAELFDGPCNAGQALLANGLMLFTAPPVSERTHLTAYLSVDNGRSWKAAKVLSELAGGYSDDAVTQDGTILTIYENGHDKTKPHGLLLARYNVEWLQEKK
jgi:sialidase-1